MNALLNELAGESRWYVSMKAPALTDRWWAPATTEKKWRRYRRVRSKIVVAYRRHTRRVWRCDAHVALQGGRP